MRPQPTVTHRTPETHRPAGFDALLTAFYGVAGPLGAIWGLRALLGVLLAFTLAAPAAAELTVCVGKGIRLESERKPCRTFAKRPGLPPIEVRMALATMDDVATPASVEPAPAVEPVPTPYVWDGAGLFLGRFMGNDGGNWWVFTPDGELQVYGSSDGVAYGTGMTTDVVTYQDVTPPLTLAPMN